jgi:phosphoglycolate phosphatase
LKYKLIIFDFDGTMADTFPFVMSVMNQVIDKYGLKSIDQDEIEMLRNYDARKIMKYLGIPAWKVPVIGRHAMTLLAKEVHRLFLFDGIEQLLRRLSDRGIKLAIVTSNSYENVCRILGPEIAALVQYYECGVPMFGKQSKLKKVLKKSGIAAEESICIGDEIRDIQAARKANIPFGAVSWGYTKEAALRAHSPSELFTSVAEMEERIS